MMLEGESCLNKNIGALTCQVANDDIDEAMASYIRW